MQLIPRSGSAVQAAANDATGGEIIAPETLSQTGTLFHNCGCSNAKFSFEVVNPQQFRTMSNEHMAGGDTANSFGWTNMVWAYDLSLFCYDIGLWPARRSTSAYLHHGHSQALSPGMSPGVSDGCDWEYSILYTSVHAFVLCFVLVFFHMAHMS
jgi:hypothetical protein